MEDRFVMMSSLIEAYHTDLYAERKRVQHILSRLQRKCLKLHEAKMFVNIVIYSQLVKVTAN